MKNSKYNFVYYFIAISLVLIATVIGSFSEYILEQSLYSGVSSQGIIPRVTVILDAGHGGEDSGAVGTDGTLEKILNLELCNNISDILTSHGIEVVMTRKEDRLLYNDDENIKGKRKQYDLKNRAEIAKETENAYFVSIHMNKFSAEQYRGLQVYYSRNNSESKNLAQTVQTMTKEYLQDHNTRQIKESKGNIYLLDVLECPAILIECGFLSNTEDCRDLNDKEYRKKLSLVISMSIMENIC